MQIEPGSIVSAGGFSYPNVCMVCGHFLQTPDTGFCDIFPPVTVIASYAMGLGKLPAKGQHFIGAETAVSCARQLKLYQAFFVRFVFITATLHTPAQIKPKSFESRRPSPPHPFFFLLFFFSPSGHALCLRTCLDGMLLPPSKQYPNSKHRFTTSFLQALPY